MLKHARSKPKYQLYSDLFISRISFSALPPSTYLTPSLLLFPCPQIASDVQHIPNVLSTKTLLRVLGSRLNRRFPARTEIQSTRARKRWKAVGLQPKRGISRARGHDKGKEDLGFLRVNKPLVKRGNTKEDEQTKSIALQDPNNICVG